MGSVRTCLGCRERTDSSLLIRLVALNGEAVVDSSATRNGRGAWVHPSTRCAEKAIARKAIARALRADGALETAEFLAAITRLSAGRHDQWAAVSVEQYHQHRESAPHPGCPNEQAD